MNRAAKDPPPSDAIFALETFVPFRLSVLSNRMTRAVARVYAQRFRLSAPEWRTLAVLGRYGAVTANSVVERTAMDKVRVSRAVSRLLKTGYITRRSDPEDRRRVILELTQAGGDVYRQIVPRALAVESGLLSCLSAGERSTFDAALAALERSVERTADEIEE